MTEYKLNYTLLLDGLSNTKLKDIFGLNDNQISEIRKDAKDELTLLEIFNNDPNNILDISK